MDDTSLLSTESIALYTEAFHKNPSKGPVLNQLGLWTYSLGPFLISLGLPLLILSVMVVLLLACLQPNTTAPILISCSLGIGGLTLLLKWTMRHSTPNNTGITLENRHPLYQDINRLCKTYHCPKFTQIAIHESPDIQLQFQPTLGYLFCRPNLSIGLPLLLTLSESELRHLVTYQCTLLGRSQPFWRRFVYQTYVYWTSLLTHQTLYAKAIKHIIKPFHALAFHTVKTHLLQSERDCASLIGKKPYSIALTKMRCLSDYINHSYWAPFHKKAVIHKTPIGTPFSTMKTALQLSQEDISPYFNAELTRLEGYSTPTQNLKTRLDNIGISPNEAPTITNQTTSGHAFFGDDLMHFVSTFDRAWLTEINDIWKDRHQAYQTSQETIKELEAKKRTSPLSVSEQWQLASHFEDIYDSKASFPLFIQIADKNPEFAPGLFDTGRLYLKNRQEKGIRYLEKAMSLNPACIPNACERLYRFYIEQKEPQKAQQIVSYANTHEQHVILAQQERSEFKTNDTLIPHHLKPTQLTLLQTQLQTTDRLEKVYLVQKQCQYFPERPLFIVGLLSPIPDHHNQLSNTLTLPSDFIIVPLSNHPKSLENTFKNVQNSLISNSV